MAPVKRGGIVIFSSCTPHATGPNNTDGIRKAYILQYAPVGIRPIETLTEDGYSEAAPVNEDRQFAIMKGGEAV